MIEGMDIENKDYQKRTVEEYRHFFYFVRWCLQHSVSDDKILELSNLTQAELRDLKKEVIEFFGDERGKYPKTL